MRFNPKLTALAFAASTAIATFSAQASTVDVKVIGTIVPGACVATLAGGGTVDYGKIGAAEVSQADVTKLPLKSIPFTISCDAPTKIALKAVDNRAGSLDPEIEAGYGLGTVSGVNVGGYSMYSDIASFTADGETVKAITSTDDGSNWTILSRANISPRKLMSWSVGGKVAVPVAFKNLSGPLMIQTTLNKGAELPLTEEIPLDGSATIELVYL